MDTIQQIAQMMGLGPPQQTPTPQPVGPTYYQTLETRDVLPKELLDGAAKIKAEDVDGIVLKCVKEARKVRNQQQGSLISNAGSIDVAGLDPAYTFAVNTFPSNMGATTR